MEHRVAARDATWVASLRYLSIPIPQDVIDSRERIQVSRQILFVELDVQIAGRHVHKLIVLRIRMLPQNIGSVGGKGLSPFLTPPPHFEAGAVQKRLGERTADRFSVPVNAKRTEAAESFALNGWDLFPCDAERLECIGEHFVVGVDANEKLTTGFARPKIEGGVLAVIGLPEIANGEWGLFHPSRDQVAGAVLRAVVDNNPLKIGVSLRQNACRGA